jgi:hypothetical protein
MTRIFFESSSAHMAMTSWSYRPGRTSLQGVIALLECRRRPTTKHPEPRRLLTAQNLDDRRLSTA